MAPIIPSLNDHEILAVAKAVKEAGAKDFSYQVLSLNGPVEENFRVWVENAFPERGKKIMSQVAEMHGGKVNDSRFGTRMRGEGNWAESIKQQYKLAKRKYFPELFSFHFNLDLFEQSKEGQLRIRFQNVVSNIYLSLVKSKR